MGLCQSLVDNGKKSLNYYYKCHDIAEILLKVALNTTTLTLKPLLSNLIVDDR